MSRVVGLYGSPRPQGHSARLLDQALAAAEDAGAQVKQLHLQGLRLQACMACEACANEGACRQGDDDAARLLDELRSSDALILASPVYFFGVPAQLKALIDRGQLFWWRGELRRRSGLPTPRRKPAYAIITAGQDRPGEFAGVVGSLRAFCFSLDFAPQPPLLVPGVDHTGLRQAEADILHRARAMGWAAAAKVLETKTGHE